MEGQAHDFERQQQVGKDDGRIDAEGFRGRDGDLGGELGLLADLDERMLFADGAVFGHVASGLAHEPDGRAVDRLRLAGFDEAGFRGRHESVNVTFLGDGTGDLTTVSQNRSHRGHRKSAKDSTTERRATPTAGRVRRLSIRIWSWIQERVSFSRLMRLPCW